MGPDVKGRSGADKKNGGGIYSEDRINEFH